MSKTILIVEDHPDALEFFEELLTEAGYQVLTAEDGQQGLEIAESEAVDAAILDVMLPQLSGREVFDRLRSQSRYKKLPVIFITAEQGDNVKDLLSQPNTYYLKKAIDVKELKSTIAKALGAKK